MTFNTALVDLHAWVLQQLQNAVTFAVFDVRPPGEARPYLYLGGKNETAGPRTFERDATEPTVEIHGFSAVDGDSEAVAMVKQVRDALHGRRLTTSEFGTIALRFLESPITPDPEGGRVAVIRYRTVAMATP